MKTFCKYAIYCVVWWHKSSLCAVFSLSDITRVIKACFSVYFSLLYTKYSQSKLNKVNTGTSFIDSSFTALFFSLCDIPWLLVHQRDNKTKQNKTKDANSIWEYQLNDLLVVRQQNPSTMSPERRAWYPTKYLSKKKQQLKTSSPLLFYYITDALKDLNCLLSALGEKSFQTFLFFVSLISAVLCWSPSAPLLLSEKYIAHSPFDEY